MTESGFTGTVPLVRLIVKRDWLLLAAWAIVMIVLAAIVVASFGKLYPTPEALKEFADSVTGNTGEIALLGNVLSPTLGGITAWRLIMPAFIIGGLASLLAVIHYTRSEEETGRRELIDSTAIGQYAVLASALIVAFGVNLVIAIMSMLAFLGFGLPAAGSAALALSIGASGCLMAGVGAIAAQLAQNTGTARGIAGVVLAVAYILRVIGDGANLPLLSWLSFTGWMQQMRPFAGEQWWVLLLFVVSTVVLAVAAFSLHSKRDIDTGLLPQRPGPEHASAWLNSPLTLAWRLQKGMLLGWVAGYALIGLLIGYLANTVAEQLAANPQFMEYLKHLGGNATPADSFFTMGVMILGEITAAYALLATLKIQSEETESHAETVLSGPVGRLQWMAGHLAIALAGTVVVLLTFGICAGLTYGLSNGNAGMVILRVMAAVLAYVPAIWVIAGLAVALFGALPRFTLAAWAAFVGCLLLELAGELQLVSGVILDISPFTHVSKLLVSDLAILPMAALVVIALAFMAIGLAGFQRRDVD
ncbi:putative ABC transporter [Methanocella paludicola SANAE]|uniref:ABC transporter n=1 Tax=Methanocella paludicola (strain DSM 17711 / JCM 13418 / NBRC 101707 / SANAE) TaxID=304371 RepID=D1YZ32_METPS|nr:ABC transporter [Methanocella paludicola]BAI61704.1 putative ABC transporter [Methanocella paludicola SANAE]